jgi:hypothetical protein
MSKNRNKKTYGKLSTEICDKIAASEKKRRAALKKSNTTEDKLALHFMDIDAKTTHDTQGAADAIWRTFQPLRLTPWMNQPYDVKVDIYHKKFPTFCSTFPVIIKYMINDGIFSHKAFEQYLKKLKTCSPRTKEEWAERQADYVKYCVLDMDKKPGKMKRAQYAWTEVKSGLMEDMDDMKKEMDLAKKLAADDVKKLAKDRREDLREKLKTDPAMRERLVAMLAQREKDKAVIETKEKEDVGPKTVWMTMDQRDAHLKQMQDDADAEKK